MTDFEAMGIMASKNMDIRMSGTILNVDSGKKKSTITMQIDTATAQQIMAGMVNGNPTVYVAVYVINMEQFNEIKNSPAKAKGKTGTGSMNYTPGSML